MRAFSLAFLLVSPLMAAAAYPDKPVRLVVPQPPGGGADIIARLLAQKLSANLKQEVVVDNRGGAGGIVGTTLVAHTQPDGYTLLLGYTGSLTINPGLYRDLPYRPRDDFAPVGLVAASPFLLVVNPSLRVNSVAELAALAKARTTPLTYGSPGNGSLHHLSMEWFKSALGINLTHVPYKGSQSVTAAIAGEVSMTVVSVVGALPHVKAGRLTAIAVTSASRFRLLPELPTVAEAGIPGFAAANWFGILAPRATPPAIIATLNAAIVAQMKTSDLNDRLLKDGADPIGGTPEQFAALIESDTARWSRIIRMTGARVD